MIYHPHDGSISDLKIVNVSLGEKKKTGTFFGFPFTLLPPKRLPHLGSFYPSTKPTFHLHQPRIPFDFHNRLHAMAPDSLAPDWPPNSPATTWHVRRKASWRKKLEDVSTPVVVDPPSHAVLPKGVFKTKLGIHHFGIVLKSPYCWWPPNLANPEMYVKQTSRDLW